MFKHEQTIRTSGENLTGILRPDLVKVDKSLFVFGGDGHVTDELRYLDLNNMHWKVLSNISGKPPSKRYGHTATKWNDSVIVFGGCTEEQEYCNDINIFNTKTATWYQPSITGSLSARYLHSATVYEDKLYVYGGFAKASDCTFVLDEMCILDLETMTWTIVHNMPPRYNHSATLVGNKIYIYAGKDEKGTTVSDLFMIHLQTEYYTPHLLVSNDTNESANMILAKSQHFCEEICGKLFVFGTYKNPKHMNNNGEPEVSYNLWMLDLDTLEWEKQECSRYFEVGGWNYFSVIRETLDIGTDLPESQIFFNSLLFLGNTDSFRLQGHDYFRDALVISSESLGLYDTGKVKPGTTEFIQLLNNPELSDFSIITGEGIKIHVHQVILLSRWPHFKNMYKSGMFESIAKKITMPEPYNVVIAFLKFLYSGLLDSNESWLVVCELLLLSDLYLLHRLKKLCCERLYMHHMSIKSCGYIFEKAIMTEEAGLKILTLEFMFQNYGALLKTNTLMSLPTLVQEEFNKAVPEEAVLQVCRSKLGSVKSNKISKSRIISQGHNSNTVQGINQNRNQNLNHLVEYTNNAAQNTQSIQAELIPIDVTVGV